MENVENTAVVDPVPVLGWKGTASAFSEVLGSVLMDSIGLAVPLAIILHPMHLIEM